MMSENVGDLPLPDLNMLLLKALVSGMSFHMGTKALADIFSKEPTNYFPDNFHEVTSCIGPLTPQGTIDKINQCICKMVKWVKTYSENVEKENVDKQERYDQLQHSVNKVTRLISKLQNEVGEALSVFIIFANVHLILLQELAVIDPTTAGKSITSKHVEELKIFANTYIDFAQITYDEIVTARTKTISSSVHTGYELLHPVTHGQFADYVISAWWTDTHVNIVRKENIIYTYDKYSAKYLSDVSITEDWIDCQPSRELLAKMEKERAEYKQDVMNKLSLSLNNPVETIHTWRRLEQQPLPFVPVVQSTDGVPAPLEKLLTTRLRL